MSIYTPLENTHLIQDWTALLAMSAEDVAELQKTWDTTFELNMRLYRNARADEKAAVEHAAEFLTSQGVEIYKYNRSGRSNEFLAWFENNVASAIRGQYPGAPQRPPFAHTMEQEVDGYTLRNNTSPTTLVELHARLTEQYKKAEQRERHTNALLREALSYSEQHGLDTDDKTNQQIINAANNHAAAALLAEVEYGTPMDLNTMFHNCDDCNLYFTGDHRCSCGNRRIHMYAEGDLMTGFDVILEAY